MIHNDAYRLNLAMNEFRTLAQFLHELPADSRTLAFMAFERAMATLQEIHATETTLNRGVVALEAIALAIKQDMDSREIEQTP